MIKRRDARALPESEEAGAPPSVEELLRNIAVGVSTATGEHFFQSLVLYLARALGVEFAFVGERYGEDNEKIKTLSLYAHGRVVDNIEYRLADTPCETIVTDGFCTYAANVQGVFPKDHLLTEMGVESYSGTPLKSMSGEVLGLMAVMDSKPLTRQDTVEALLQIFAGRAAAELERARTEAALRESESKYRRLVELAQEGIWAIDRDGCTTFVNPRMAAMLGYTQEEMEGKHLFAFMDERGVEISKRNLERRRQGISEQHDFELLHKDGSRIYTTMETAPIADSDGNYAGAIAGVIDLTGRRRAEKAVRENEEFLRLSQEAGHVGSWNWDVGTQRVSWSDEMYRIYGLTPATFDGSFAAAMQAIHPDDRERVEHQVQDMLREGRQTDYDFRIVRPDGGERIVWARGLVVRDESGGAVRVVGTVQDVTEFKATADLSSRFGRVLDHSSNEIYIFDADSLRFTQVNRGARENLGYSLDELKNLTPLDLKPEYTAEQFDKLIGPLRRGEKDFITFKTRHRRKDGSLYPVEVRLQLSRTETPPVFVAIIQDISEREQAALKMGKLSSALQQTADAVMITDNHGVIEFVNPAFEETTGYTLAEAKGQTPRLIKSDKHDAAFYQKLWGAIRAGRVFRDVLINRKKDGTLYYEEKTITPLKDSQGNVTHFISTGKDITERMQTQERLQYLAYHDMLTELPNRALLSERLEHALARSRWNKRLMAVLFLDLDRFKNINDTLGHEVGDRLLQALAERLRDCVREGDTVARLSGDEFAILLEDVATTNDIVPVARKILEAFTRPFEVFERELFVTSSIGVSVYPADGDDVVTLLRHADTAMYRAKEQGRNTYQFYSADMSAKAVERLTLETGLRRALERREFVLYFQPQVDLPSGRVSGAEALLRWQHPELGLVQPGDFIPLLEETGLIMPVGEWVVDTVCTRLKRWRRVARGALRVAVNLSARQFGDPELAIRITDIVRRHGIEPEELEFEITESIVMGDVPESVATLNALSGMGFRFAIDDFGTGYSSLSYLKRFAINTLKVDRSFVRDIPGDTDDSAIVTTIVAMAHNLKLEVVAEGVETEEQLAFLRACGCDGYQGYLFSRPVPAEQFTRLLQESIRRNV